MTWGRAFNGHGPDLFGLCLGLDPKARVLSCQEHLEWEHLGDRAGDRTVVTTPRPSRAAVALARSLLTMTAGRRLFASPGRAGSRSVRRISPRSINESVGSLESQSTASPEASHSSQAAA